MQWVFIGLKQKKKSKKRQNLHYHPHKKRLKQNSAKSGVLLSLWETFENAKLFKHVKVVFASLTYKKK